MRRGAALAMVVLALLALSAVAAVTVLVSMASARAAALQAAAERARHDAESIALEAAATWSTRAADAWLDTGMHAYLRRGEGSDSQRVHIHRLGPGLRLLTARSWVGVAGREARASAGLLVRVVEPVELLGGFPAAVLAPAIRLGEDADVAAHTGQPAGTAAAPCAAVAVVDSVFGPLPALQAQLPPEIQDGATVVGAIRADSADPGLIMDTLFWRLVGGRATDRPAGIVRDLPGHDWRLCVSGPVQTGTGTPSCPRGAPLLYAPGDLTLRGATGHGLLLVEGALRLEDRTRFTGAVAARGVVELDGGSRVEGAVRSDRGVTVRDGAVRYDACALWDAFATGPGLDGAFRLPARWWVPTF